MMWKMLIDAEQIIDAIYVTMSLDDNTTHSMECIFLYVGSTRHLCTIVVIILPNALRTV